MKQSPIFTKTYDFLVWLLNHTKKFPKHERFRMARRLEDTAFEFYDLLIKATRHKRRKEAILLEADITLEKLRLYIRLSNSCELTTTKQYQYVSKVLLEIGKLLGGWLKSLRRGTN
jgi:hypothetical protein